MKRSVALFVLTAALGCAQTITISGPTDAASVDASIDPAIAAALSTNSDIQSKFAFYLKPDYEYTRYASSMIDEVGADMDAIAGEKDKAKFLKDSRKLKEDFDRLDVFDDNLRKYWLI